MNTIVESPGAKIAIPALITFGFTSTWMGRSIVRLDPITCTIVCAATLVMGYLAKCITMSNEALTLKSRYIIITLTYIPVTLGVVSKMYSIADAVAIIGITFISYDIYWLGSGKWI